MSHRLRADHSGAGKKLITWDELDNTDDIEVLAKMRASVDGGTSDMGLGSIILRGAGAVGSENAFTFVMLTSGCTIRRYSNGTDAQLQWGDGNPASVAVNQWFWMRAQAIGSALKLRGWLDGNAEPGVWHAETTSALHASGFAGVGQGAGSGTFDCGFFSYGLNGAAAPDPA